MCRQRVLLTTWWPLAFYKIGKANAIGAGMSAARMGSTSDWGIVLGGPTRTRTWNQSIMSALL
jgi:hypothetical protein